MSNVLKFEEKKKKKKEKAELGKKKNFRLKMSYKKYHWDFPGGPVVKTTSFQGKRAHRFDSRLGN